MKKIVIPNDILLGEVSGMLAEGMEVIIMTKGYSMLPFIIGDRDSVKLRKSDSLRIGDIVLAEVAKGRYVLHRVFEIDGDRITLMGDGNLYGTEQCHRSDIKGTVTDIITPKGRHKKVTDGKIWRRLRPFRRIILGIYRRLLKLCV
ncbi:MAG: S24/S26 family peptidase [Bacteroidales bacterium]|nr:S24/S26 family peptidase [Candidatus Cryptobacteroides onthequi]